MSTPSAQDERAKARLEALLDHFGLSRSEAPATNWIDGQAVVGQ
ncbi:hypothetical protein [Kushneria konosiri]|nr:hypothetical protein [Kushneria konosiri]